MYAGADNVCMLTPHACTTAGSVDDDSLELEIKVKGMMCEGCTGRVQEALQGASPNVKKVEVGM